MIITYITYMDSKILSSLYLFKEMFIAGKFSDSYLCLNENRIHLKSVGCSLYFNFINMELRRTSGMVSIINYLSEI